MNSPEAPPGPGAAREGAQGTSLDAFFGSRFHLVQPNRGAYRSGLDALLVAAAVPEAAAGRLADLGAGAGAVGFACALRAPALSVTLVEREAAMADCARAGLVLPENAAFSGRVETVETDLLAPRGLREAAGLADGAFDWVVSNPPFYGATHRRSPEALRANALSMEAPDALRRWVAVAGALARPRGRLALVIPPEAIGTVLDACANRFGDVGLAPIHARPDRPAIRVVLTAVRGSKAPPKLLPGRSLYDETGAESAFACAISAGNATIGALT